jgi:hypothetical protein
MTPLIDEMRAQIHATPMEAAPVHSGWRRRRTTGLISGAALALAAIVAAVVVLVSGGSSAPPAYAAVFHTVAGQRTVTITLREWRDLSKLNELLAADHTRIRVVPVVRGCVAPVRVVIGAYRGVSAHVAPGPAHTLKIDAVVKPFQVTIAVNTLPGRTLIFPVTRSHMLGNLSGPGNGVVIGPPPRCVGVASGVNAQVRP